MFGRQIDKFIIHVCIRAPLVRVKSPLLCETLWKCETFSKRSIDAFITWHIAYVSNVCLANKGPCTIARVLKAHKLLSYSTPESYPYIALCATKITVLNLLAILLQVWNSVFPDGVGSLFYLDLCVWVCVGVYVTHSLLSR